MVIHDQSNCSLAKSKLFDLLSIKGETFLYTLRTCAGTTQTEGRHAKDLVIKSLDGYKQHLLPTITECNAIPDNKDDIPTPDVAMAHPNHRPIADLIPAVKPDTDILLLIGRDVPALHKVRESRNGKENSPWGQRLDLGWVILGNACLDGVHRPDDRSSFKTHILQDGRPSIFKPCSNAFHVERPSTVDEDMYRNVENRERKESFVQGNFQDGIAKDVFVRTKDDNIRGLSVEDRRFIAMMEANMRKNELGNWVAPLPFRHEVTQLPNSQEEAYKCLRSTRKTLDRKPEMKSHYFAFMQKILGNGQAEPIPPHEISPDRPCWYLPHFGVYHP